MAKLKWVRQVSSVRTILVTGGSSGIGRATAIRFARDGDTVVIADINESGGKAVIEEIESDGGKAIFGKVDVADDESVKDLVDFVERESGAPGVLVNCAGLLQNPSRLVDLDMAEHDRIWAVNYRGTYLCCRAFAPSIIKAGGGSIINISSASAVRVFPLLAYSPAKAAIDQLTAILAADLGPDGVRVNAVLPGYVRSEQMQSRIDAGLRDASKMKAQSALDRMVEPGEIADAIHFLCSDAARAITGTVLPIDAGYLASSSYQLHAGWTSED